MDDCKHRGSDSVGKLAVCVDRSNRREETRVIENNNVRFQKIPEACKSTGLSQYFLRKGCREGTIPHVRSGSVYYIDVLALLKKLGA